MKQLAALSQSVEPEQPVSEPNHLPPAVALLSGTSAQQKAARPLGLLTLCAATFFIVSGGPYGLEEIVVGHGYARSLALLCLVPILWSLPVALLVGELSSSLPEEGGYYAWVRRGLGPFWGFQEAWLMLATSLFDMAIYPTLFVTYLGRMVPSFASTSPGSKGWWVGVGMIFLCAFWNLRGSRAVGLGATVLGLLLLSPFVTLVGCALASLSQGGWQTASAMLSASPPEVVSAGALLAGPSPALGSAWVSGFILCMWNYMGWDNASTVAGEVENPQRTYPRAMFITVALVSLSYVLTVLAAAASGLPPQEWTAGSWVEVARRLGGPLLAGMIVVGGMLCGLGMFNVLVMSYSRLPVVMAEDGVLPKAFARREPRSGAPTLAILTAACLYAACMGLGLKRLVEIDVMLYGAGLFLQFVTLLVLRIREPQLHRPFRVPGGLVGVTLLALPPVGLLSVALWMGRDEPGFFGFSSLEIAFVVMLLGPLAYLLQRRKPQRI